MKIFNTKYKPTIVQLLVFLFVFQAIFIFLRSLLIGSASSTNLFELLISVIPDVLIILLFIKSLFQVYKNGIEKGTMDYFVLLFFVSNIIYGILIANNLLHSIYAIRLSYLPILMYFAIRFYDSSLSLSDYTSFLDSTTKWYFAFAIVSLFVYLFLPDLDVDSIKFVGGHVNYYVIRRMSGIFFSPVLWGTVMAAGSIYGYIKLNSDYSIKNLIVFCTFWSCLILSVSRGAIIPFYLGIFIVCMVYKKYLVFIKTIVITTVIFGIYCIFVPDATSIVGFISKSSVQTMKDSKVENAKAAAIQNEDTTEANQTISTRAKYWTISIEDFKNRPMGYGLGKAGHIGNRFYNSPKFKNEASIYSTDGWYLKLANETGIWGLLSYLLIFIAHSYFFFKKSELLKNEIILFSFVIFIMVAIQNFMSNVLDFYSFSCLYWLTIALVYNIEKKLRNEFSN